MSDVRLHIPDEPVDQLDRWRSRLAEGEPLRRVVEGPAGVTSWYWARWRGIERFGIGPEHFAAIAAGQRRELGLWLRGERSYLAATSSLAGRLARRAKASPARPAT